MADARQIIEAAKRTIKSTAPVDLTPGEASFIALFKTELRQMVARVSEEVGYPMKVVQIPIDGCKSTIASFDVRVERLVNNNGFMWDDKGVIYIWLTLDRGTGSFLRPGEPMPYVVRAMQPNRVNRHWKDQEPMMLISKTVGELELSILADYAKGRP